MKFPDITKVKEAVFKNAKKEIKVLRYRQSEYNFVLETLKTMN